MAEPTAEEEKVVWMTKPEKADSPPGLECLANLDKIWVIQRRTVKEQWTKWVPKGSFWVQNEQEEKIFNVAEEPESEKQKNLAGEDRGFTLHCGDENDTDVLQIQRPFKLKSAFFSSLTDSSGWEVLVYAPPGQLVGKIKQKGSWLHKKFEVFDENGSVIFQIHGPLVETSFLKEDIEFKVLAGDVQVGSILRKFISWKQELLANAQNFLLTIPAETSVKAKTLLLASIFLVEYICYEGGTTYVPAYPVH